MPEIYIIQGVTKAQTTERTIRFFYAMRAVLALDEVDFKKHSGVIQYFQREYIKTGIFEKSCSTVIMSASEIRNASDYDDFYLASAEEAQEQIDNAVAFAGVIEEYLNNTPDK